MSIVAVKQTESRESWGNANWIGIWLVRVDREPKIVTQRAQWLVVVWGAAGLGEAGRLGLHQSGKVTCS